MLHPLWHFTHRVTDSVQIQNLHLKFSKSKQFLGVCCQNTRWSTQVKWRHGFNFNISSYIQANDCDTVIKFTFPQDFWFACLGQDPWTMHMPPVIRWSWEPRFCLVCVIFPLRWIFKFRSQKEFKSMNIAMNISIYDVAGEILYIIGLTCLFVAIKVYGFNTNQFME